MVDTSKVHDKPLAKLNNKFLDLMNKSGILAPDLLSLLSKITNAEHISQFTLVTNPESNRVNDLLMNKTLPITLYDIILTFCDTEKSLNWKEVFRN